MVGNPSFIIGCNNHACSRISLRLWRNRTLFLKSLILQRYTKYHIGDLTISSAKLSIILVISIITTNIGIFLSGLKKLRFNYRLMALISIIGVSGSTYALSYMETLYSYLLLYGVLFGLFLGYGYLVPVRNCYDYLPEKKGIFW